MSDKINVKSLLAYALPAVPLAALTLPLYIIIPSFYVQTVGLPLAAVGTIILIIRLFDAVNDPIIGFMSDRITLPLGRRRGWLLFSIPIVSIGIIMVFIPSESASTTYLLVWGGLLTIGTTMALVPYSAWGAEMSPDYDERSRISGFREIFVIIGTLIAITLPALFRDDQATGLFWLATFIAIALPLFALFAVFYVPEPVNRGTKRVGLIEGLGVIGKNKPFRKLLLAFFINGFANGFPATLFIFYTGSILGAGAMQGPLLFLYFISAVVGVPLWLALAKRSSKHEAWSIAMVIACAFFACVPLLGENDLLLFAIICVITGITLGADLTLPASMQADVIDVDREMSGEQRAGLFFAAWSFSTKAAVGFAAALAFLFLDSVGFDATAPEQPLYANWMLIGLYSAVPVVLKLTAIAIMLTFPLTRPDVRFSEFDDDEI